MDATKLDYTLTNPHSPQHSSRYTPTTLPKNQDHQVFFSVSAMSSHFDPNSFDLARNFGPVSIAQLNSPPYHYPRPCDILSPPDQHRRPFPQAPLTDVTTYIYDSASASYPSNPQESQSPYHSGHEAFHVNVNDDLGAHSVSLSLNASLGLSIQTPTTPFSSVPSNYSAVRRYHADQSLQHAQVLQQLTHLHDRPPQSSTEHPNRNGVLSPSLEITPTGRRAEFYHAASSIPMSNIPPHQPRPPEHASHQLHHTHQSKNFNQYQYPYYHNQRLEYPDSFRSDVLDDSPTHVQGIGIYESAQQPPPFSIQVPIPSPPTTNSTTIALESSVYTIHPGPHSSAIRSISQPSTHSFEGTTGTSKVHPTASIPDVAPITPPPINGTGHEEDPSACAEEGCNLIEIESEGDDEEKLTSEPVPLKEDDGMENVVSNHSGASMKRRDRKQTEGTGATARRKTGDAKTDSIIKDGLSPPTKKRKKSKMHECQVCHKNFPRPSGLKTHMNTHNNERPYPCPFPGCNRSFGVRSNAKRHLRTHGVIPPQNTGTQPYVVDFSTPMVLEQDGGLGLNGEGTGSCNEDDDRPEGVPHTRRPGRPGRGRGRQFKLRWMPPSSSTKSGVVKGKGRKKATDSPPVEPVDHGDVKPLFSRSLSQSNVFLGHGEEDQDEEDADGNTDGEADIEMDFDDEGDDQDDESEAEDVDRSEEEFGASTAMRARGARFHPSSSQHSQASSSRTSLSSSLSASVCASTGSTSATSLPLSASSSSFPSMSPIRAKYVVDSGA